MPWAEATAEAADRGEAVLAATNAALARYRDQHPDGPAEPRAFGMNILYAQGGPDMYAVSVALGSWPEVGSTHTVLGGGVGRPQDEAQGRAMYDLLHRVDQNAPPQGGPSDPA
jgi:hypothetical protein